MQTASTPHRTATDLVWGLPLSIAGKKLLAKSMTPAQYLKALVDHGHYVDALRLMAVALLPQEAVWWACLCCRHTLGTRVQATPAEEQALRAGTAWVMQPDETHSKEAARAGAVAGPNTSAGCVAQAASHAGVAAPHARPVPSQPVVVAKLATAAVLLAAVAGPTADLDLNYRQFIALGIDVDNHL